MEFLFEWSARYLTDECSESVRYKGERKEKLHNFNPCPNKFAGEVELCRKFPTIKFLTERKLQAKANLSSLQYAFYSPV